MRALIEHVHPTGRLLLLRALSAEGEVHRDRDLSRDEHDGLLLGWRELAEPSDPAGQRAPRLGGDELLETPRGDRLDLGAGEYKRKFGVQDVAVPHFVHSSLPGLGAMRGLVRLLRTSERLRRFARMATPGSRQVP